MFFNFGDDDDEDGDEIDDDPLPLFERKRHGSVSCMCHYCIQTS